MPNFEQQFEQETEPSFDYDQASQLARQRLELEGADTGEAKQKRSQIKNKIKELYGSGDSPKRRIFDLELAKQRLLMQLEEGENLPANLETRNINYGAEGEFFTMRHLEKNYQIKASLGDLISDINWGIYYQLADNVPAEMRKKYSEAVYQAQVSQLYDQQLLIQRTKLEKDQLDDFYLATYEKVQADMAKGGGESAGLLFEKMIHNLLAKISVDLQKWGIKIEQATVIEDVEEKIDFIIHLPKKKRGVGFEDIPASAEALAGEEKTLGIQFTLKSAKSEDFRKKQRQIARSLKKKTEVDDLILVSVPVSHDQIFSKYKKWQYQDKLPGGPENMFKPAEIVEFVKQILQNTGLTENEEFLKDIEDYFNKKR